MLDMSLLLYSKGHAQALISVTNTEKNTQINYCWNDLPLILFQGFSQVHNYIDL